MDGANPLTSLEGQLGEIPHSLQLHELFKVKDELCRAILRRLQSERERPSDGDDLIRSFNFTSLLLFRLKQREEALKENKYVLSKSPNNVTAMVNKVFMKMALGYEREALILLKDLQKLWTEGDPSLRAAAFAEEAYCLSRIRPKFYLRSIDLFVKAITICPDVYLWKFGCSVVYKRCLATSKCIKGLCPEKLKAFCNCALKYLYEVIENGNDCLKARSWVCLGELMNTFKNPVYPLTFEIVETVNTDPRLTAEECFNNALRSPTAENDEIVLEKCGNGLRFARRRNYKATLQECYKLLLMAYRLRPTPYVCDKLATILVKLLEENVNPDTKAIYLGPGYRVQNHMGGRGNRNNSHRWATHNPSWNNRNMGFHNGRRGYNGNNYQDSYMNRFNHVHQQHDFSENFNSKRLGQDNNQRFTGHGRGRAAWRGRGRGNGEVNVRAEAETQSQLNPNATPFVLNHTGQFQQREDREQDSLSFAMGGLALTPKPRRSMQKEKFKKSISSPPKVKTFPPDNPLINEAIMYLNESLSLSQECNSNALYQLGLMHRRLEDNDGAIEKFRSICADLDATLFNRINAYEQRGFCHLDKSKNPELSETECQKEKKEGKFMLKRAVEEAACLVASLPTMSREDLDSWESYPTLKELLSYEPRPKHMKEIARLCQLIGNTRESLDWYVKLRQLDPNDMDTLHNVVISHIRLEDFKTAQNSFNVLMGSSEGRQLLAEKPDLFNQVYLGTIRHLTRSYSEEDMENLKMSCRTIFDYKHRKSSSSEGTEDCDRPYDIFMLDESDMTESEAEAIQTWLTDKCGLSVTRHDNDVNFGSYSLLHEASLIANCKIVIVVLGSRHLDNRLKTLLSIALGEKGSDFVVCVGSDELEVPSLLRGSLSVKRPPKEEGNAGHQRFLLQCFMSTLGLNFETFPWIE